MIYIIDDWYMTADRYCYTVGKRKNRTRTNKEGESVDESFFDHPTYHTTVGSALRSILQEGVQDKVAKGKITDLATLFAEMEKYNLKLIKEFDRLELGLNKKRRP